VLVIIYLFKEYKVMDNQVSATLKYALLSDKKMNLIADLVRGKKATEAMTALEFLPKK
jgi:ribosomal protein L22